jgi:hypothetical protein
MMFGVPRAGRLVKPAHPNRRVRDQLVTNLEAFEIVFLRRDEILAENSKFFASHAENDIGVGPRIVVATMGLPWTREAFGGDEDLEFARRVLVLCQRRRRVE